MSTFSGVITALVTPFRRRRSTRALRRRADDQIANGIDGLVPVGTTGESPTLSFEEHVRVIKVVVETAKKRVPVIAGTGSNSTREAIELSQAAKESGADGLLLVTPYYNKPGQGSPLPPLQGHRRGGAAVDGRFRQACPDARAAICCPTRSHASATCPRSSPSRKRPDRRCGRCRSSRAWATA
jgi:hypothetical protein